MKPSLLKPPLPLGPPADLDAAAAAIAVDNQADDQADNQALAQLLAEPLAQAWALPAVPAGADALRSRLLGRAAASRQAERGFVTVRRRGLARQALADGVVAQCLYTAPPGPGLRPGEPLRVRLIELASGACISPDLLGPDPQDAGGRPLPCRREWLLLSGEVSLGDQTLSARDYHLTPAGQPLPTWVCHSPALLFLRESADSAPTAGPAERAFTLRDGDAGWPDFAPGVQRRVLWQRGGQAALLYLAQAGAQVPQHCHGHDEECLMLQGELYLDDLLLQAGDYQLAPAGSGHRITQTDAGAVIYAHGDVDFQFVA